MEYFKILALVFLPFVLPQTPKQQEFFYQSYQDSISCVSQYPPSKPHSITDIQNIVRYAIAHNVDVKVVGNRHSVSDEICTSGIPVNLSYIRHFSYDANTTLVTAGAGIEIVDLLEKIHVYGRGITGAPSFGGITLGGAIANGAHGTGLKYPSTLSQQLYSVKLVDGRGKVRKITKFHEDFKAFRVNLGLLGIIYEVELETRPQYKLHIRHYPISDNIIRNGTDIMGTARDWDHFQFWWFPSNKQIVLSVGTRAPVGQPGNCETRYISDVPWLTSNALSHAIETFQDMRDDIGIFHVQNYARLSLFKEVPGRQPVFVEDDGESPCLHDMAIGFSHRMTSNKCHECAWDRSGTPLKPVDGNVVIPARKLMPAMRTLSEMFDKQLTQFPLNGIFFRFLGPSDAYMAMNSGDEDWVSIEWITVARWQGSQPRLGIAAFQAMAQVLVEQYGGRPHWGKNGLFFTSPTIIRETYPNLHKFVYVMNKYDPDELFMNTFGERVKHGRARFTVTSTIAANCALNELCICKDDVDCGNKGMFDYTCGQYFGFPKYNVCLPGTVEQVKSAYTRRVIDMMASVEYNEDSVMRNLGQYASLKNAFIIKKHKHR